jgi:hypothetical protein
MAGSQVENLSVNPARPEGVVRTSVAHAATRLDPIDPDHHLWRNGRLFWVAFTVHLPGWKKERIRLSLGTADVVEARRRRDQMLREYPLARGCQLSLRLSPRRTARPEGGSQPTVAA